MEGMFRSSADEMGAYTGVTQNGYVFDESWLENDGLVNTISAMHLLLHRQHNMKKEKLCQVYGR